MKKQLLYLLCVSLFLSLFCGITNPVSAQSWAWGQAGVGPGVDSWPVATDAAGNVYGAGIVFGSGTLSFGGKTVPPSFGSYQSVWVKYDPTGVALWADGTISGNTYVYSIATDPFGNLILFGSFTSGTMQIGSFTLTNAYGGGAAQFYLAKVSPTGTVLWAINDGNSMSGWFYTFSTFIMSSGAVTTDAAGNIYIASSFTRKTMSIGTYTLTNTDPSGTTNDIYVAKYTALGAPVWANSIGGTRDDYAFGIAVSSTGYVYVAGDYNSPTMKVGSSVITNGTGSPTPKYALAYVAKFSSAGVPVWGEGDGFGKLGSFAVGLTKDNSGNVYMTGGFADTSISLDTTKITRTYPGASPQMALFLVQFNSTTNAITWKKTIGSKKAGVWGYTIALASCGQVWVSGNYTDTAYIDGIDTLLPPKVGGDPVFITGYNLTGGVVGYAGLSSGGDDQNQIACDGSGNVFICSDYFGNLAVGKDTLKSGGGSEYFYVAKYANSVKPDTAYHSQDTSVCVGISGLPLNAPSGYSTYTWDDGSTDSTRTVTASGTYYVFCVSCGVTVLIDTFNVKIGAPDTVLNHIDTALCADVKSLTLKGPPGFATYTWSTGATTTSIVVTTAGTYYVKAIAGCDETVDTFHYKTIPDDTLRVVSDTTVCASPNPLVLNAVAGYAPYLWNTGSTAASIPVSISSVAKSGTYNVKGYLKTPLACTQLYDTFKVTVKAIPVVSLGNDTTFCIGNTIILTSPQPPGYTYLWNTGSTADTISVSTTGTYILGVTGVNGCLAVDSVNVTVQSLPVVNLGPDTAICTGIIPTLQSSVSYPTGTTYLWNTGSTASSIPGSPIGKYWLQVTVGVCTGADTMQITNLFDTLNFPMHDTAICRGDTVFVNAKGTPGMTYQWVPTAGIPLSTTVNPVIYPDTTATYTLTASISICPDIVKSFTIDVQPNPTVYIGEYKDVCQFDTLHINSWVSPKWYNNYIYAWSPAAALDNSNTSAVLFTPGGNTNLVLRVSTPAGCKAVDSTQIIVHPGNFATMDTVINVCPHDSIQLMPKGGVAYNWHPGLYLNDSNASKPWIKPITPVSYMVVAYSEFGCRDTVYARINVGASAEMFLTDSVTLYSGESYQISPQTNCVYFSWFPPLGLDNAYISNPVATPEVNTKYTVSATTQWGCKIVDSIFIYVNPETQIALPNAFTPGSSANSEFKIIKRGIATLNSFTIFNRWGNVVYQSSNIDAGWDGTYNGVPQPFGVYVYEIDATTTSGTRFNKHGNVTLIR